MKSPQSHLSRGVSRRRFLKTTTAAAGAAVFGVPTLLRAANLNSKLHIACIGVMGKGESDSNLCAGENIVALCDVDSDRAMKQINKYPNARFYQDFHELFDEMADQIDAVTVSTPDHNHAMIASRALRLKKHVYCQKPLVQTIAEARYLKQLADETGVVTQMGNQGSAADGLRRAVECIHAGVIGQIREVHIWTNRPVWPQGMNRPDTTDPIPATLDWNNWIGPAAMRPYKKDVYNDFKWRGWQDFGTGALGDMACHTVNMPFRGLCLDYPTEIEATAFGTMNKETYPIGSKIRFEFPERDATVSAIHRNWFHHHDNVQFRPVTLWWYDGGQPLPDDPYKHDFSNKPPRELTADIEAFRGEIPNSACLLIGEKGTIFSPDDYGEEFFVKLTGDTKYLNYKKHPAVHSIPQSIRRNPFKGDSDKRHHAEWIQAIKDNKSENCYSRFAVGAQLTEIMLLGCVALRSRSKIEWDGPGMRATNCPEAAAFIKRDNREGWNLA